MQRRLSARQVLGWAATGIASLAFLALVAWSGVYNVAASRGHWPVVEWILRFGMENSVETHATDIAAPWLDDPDLVRLGAGHFLTACASCHGAPGAPPGVIAQHMLPPPPDLNKDRVAVWTDPELFWIVKHGIKYTGMPAWPTQERDDEVWALVAFLRALPSLDAEGYRSLAWGDVSDEAKDGVEVALSGGGAGAIVACARCHGAEGSPPESGLVPRLHGQPAEMLLQALRDFAGGERPSGIMQPIAAALTERAAIKVATYYARLAPLPGRGEPLEAGRTLAMTGDAAARVPACVSCHDREALAIYPRLAGQSAPYLANRLLTMRRAARDRTPTQEIMIPIARRLTDVQIADLSAYFASLRP